MVYCSRAKTEVMKRREKSGTVVRTADLNGGRGAAGSLSCGCRRYDRHKRFSARKSVNEPFIKAFQKDEHKGFLRDRIARLLQDGYQLEVVT